MPIEITLKTLKTMRNLTIEKSFTCIHFSFYNSEDGQIYLYALFNYVYFNMDTWNRRKTRLMELQEEFEPGPPLPHYRMRRHDCKSMPT